MAIVVRGGAVLTPDGPLDDHEVVLEDGHIGAIRVAGSARLAGDRLVDAAAGWIAPGLIDVHVHGGAGHDTMDATAEALEALSLHLARHGVTSFLPTTVTESNERTTAAIRAVVDAADGLPGARALGAHLEGPYLDADHRGAQRLDELRLPDPGEYERWFDSGAVRLMTLAPELDGARQLIAAGARRGLVLSAGHCGATDDEVRAAVDAGLRHATHTFNGMPPLHHRTPGAVGAVLVDERVRAELIADGIHVHPTVMALLVRVKGRDGTVLVSDATRAAGMPDGTYELGGQQVTVADGVGRTASGSLAGSTLTLDRAVANLTRHVGVSLADAVWMATASPAAALGEAHEIGALLPGRCADLAVLDDRLAVRATFVAGEPAYLREEGSRS